MLIAPYLLFAASATAGVQPDLQLVSRFIEDLVASEVVLQLDRREVSIRKANSSSVRTLMNDAAKTRALVQLFEDNVMSTVPEPAPTAIADFKSCLKSYKASLDGPLILPKKESERAPCCEHNASYIKLVGAAFRYPGFSASLISLPTQYNMAPVFYEHKFGPIYADAMYPDEARISPRSARRGSKLRSGDVIIGFRKEDDEEWESVKTWQDVMKASDEFGRENDVHIQVMRNKKVQSLTVTSTVLAVEGG